MVKISVTLYGLFREKLPKESCGKIELELPAGQNLRNLLDRFEINTAAVCAVNNQVVSDLTTRLQNGDKVQILRPAGGGFH